MNSNDRSGVIHFVQAESEIPGRSGERTTQVLKRGTLDIVLSVPLPPNRQTPHAQDEIYVIVRGRGVLVHDSGKREPFSAGDILFVSAGVEHHYEDFSADLALWRIFYGAHGG